MFSNESLGLHRCRITRVRGSQGVPQLRRMGPARVGSRVSRRPSSVAAPHSRRMQRIRLRFRPRVRLGTSVAVAAMTAPHSPPAVMVNSCTGKMGVAVAEAVLRLGLDLVPATITGESREVVQEKKGMAVGPDHMHVDFVGMEDREERLMLVKEQYPHLIIVDFTLPDCVNDNALLYGKLGLNFVMGTTGGDREKLRKDVHASGVYAVVAPQMGKQIVAFQAMLKYMSDRFPGAFAGYSLSVTESHQSSKVDTSGTAKAVTESFLKLGGTMEKGIKMIRDPETQMQQMGVPEEALLGHAYHTYHLSSQDNSVNFEFQHNVAGRTIYAEGTVDAVLFLAQQIQSNSAKKLFDMIDVLEAGSMR